jgi:tetrapyrrole methylase family protein/MazG family protein
MFALEHLTDFQRSELAWQAVAADRALGYQSVPAQRLASQYYPQVEITLPLLITALNSAALAQQLKRGLVNAYPAEHPVVLVYLATPTQTQSQALTLQTFGEQLEFTPYTYLYLPPLPATHSFSALQEIVAHLRAPEGCPWDRKQTLATMRHDLLGECAEVLEALDAAADGQANHAHIAEELGDLLMAAALIIQIATDETRFRMSDAMHSIVTKLIRRHPHVFGDTQVDGVQAIVANWDAIKAQEKADKGLPPPHPLDGVPVALPALEKARQLQSKAAKAGLLTHDEPSTLASVFTQEADSPLDEAQLGALLWRLVQLARRYDLNPEDALRQHTVKFRATAAR